mmetsp:Transcript_36662/g.88847  ORF Transcript_36662/g.88847 Transcript_36662/m.88847 type:complete len:644 (+) Transcript_36662:178-2109(+)|eukprot:CAMPEP_0113630212 /NCGR_PEP_ID=MMETSP0017_2-20120614/15694_1 /TAXON_ID=2856 /ORGANISM="Cylindrotheca closterium" /LENGTH=643 /DNA_ID=CAMNT_0000540661 /DNA_START=98 /DNA_END=2029 /DNA_ORIENTATION=- /assembly_acc=CAM_ASM_000147
MINPIHRMNENTATYFAIKSCSRLQAPVLFFSWDDASQFLHSSTLSSTEYAEFNDIYHALDYMNSDSCDKSSIPQAARPVDATNRSCVARSAQSHSFRRPLEVWKSTKRSLSLSESERSTKRRKRNRPKDDLCDTTRALSALNFERSNGKPMLPNNNTDNNKFFLYTGQIHDDIPKTVSRVRTQSSLDCIPESAFRDLKQLATVEIQKPVRVIERRAFFSCRSLREVSLPSTVKVIGDHAFRSCFPSGSLALPEGLETIGKWAFRQCEFKSMRIPLSIEELTEASFSNCSKLLSCEISEEMIRIRDGAFSYCQRLRNIAIGQNTKTCKRGVFGGCQDLLDLFHSEDALVDALKHRFDGLPLHKTCYYQSFTQNVDITQMLDMHSDEESRQDCLGMTPLHILALSSRQDIQMYQALIEHSPSDLGTRDRWGEIPLNYACHNDVPLDILRCMLETHLSLFHTEHLNWGRLIDILCSIGASREKFQLLLESQQRYSPNERFDWDKILETTLPINADTETTRFLFETSIHRRLNHLGLEKWRASVTNEVSQMEDFSNRQACNEVMQERLVEMERKEILSLVEQSVWKDRMIGGGDDGMKVGSEEEELFATRSNPYWRELCRVKCGAEIVVSNVLPFLGNYLQQDPKK